MPPHIQGIDCHKEDQWNTADRNMPFHNQRTGYHTVDQMNTVAHNMPYHILDIVGWIMDPYHTYQLLYMCPSLLCY